MKLRTLLVWATLICFTTLYTATAQTICENETGTRGDYTYELWMDNGTACMTLESDSTFSVEWSNIYSMLARTGLRPGGNDVIVDYSCNHNQIGDSYMSVYGWTTNPLVEYYIIDSWSSWRPPGPDGYLGTIVSDGGIYEIYKTRRYNYISIEGMTDFYQFWSVRTTKRTSGTITCANHFNAWADLGMIMGDFYEVSFCIEGYQSSGSAEVTSLSMTTALTTPDTTPGTTAAPTDEPTTTPGITGDTNGDGHIDIVDALIVAQYYVGLRMSNFIEANADTNRDGEINIIDALLIAQCYVGLRSCTF